MATLFSTPITRQPFAPIDASRLQTLTSLKNRQNALPTTLTSPSKRKAADYEEDFENVNPVLFSTKRAKGHDGMETCKPSKFTLTRASTPQRGFAQCTPVKSTLARSALHTRSPIRKINTTTHVPLSAPAGRSPTRKRVGILSRRKTASSFTRIDPPKYAAGPTVADAPFSIATALSGTIPSYGARQSKPSAVPVDNSLIEPGPRAGWYFDIHEDTEQETMTNLMEHSTCTLDISSDEETEARRRDEWGKENVPPMDDVSQTRGHAHASHDLAIESKARGRSMRRRKEIEEGAIDIDRAPLGEMAAEEFYADGVTEKDVVLVEEEVEIISGENEASALVEMDCQDAACAAPESIAIDMKYDSDFPVEEPPIREDGVRRRTVDEILMKLDSEAPVHAKLFEPLEKAEEGFEVWESLSAKGDD